MPIDITGLGGLAELAGKVIDKWFPDKDAQEKAILAKALQDAAHEFELSKGQIEVNKEDARSRDKFTSRARPACIWVGAASMAYVTIVEPVFRFLAQVIFHYEGQFPAIDTTITFQVLFALLGISGMRSLDKVKGKS